MTTVIAWTVVGLYLIALSGLLLYALHSLWLLVLYRFAPRTTTSTSLPSDDDLPAVLVQIPLYNERHVAARVIAACAALDWPRDKLHLQILDDSDDETTALVDDAVAVARTQGVQISVVRRSDRTGFKAGALQHGLSLNHAPYVALFDADFTPSPDFLRRALPPLLEADDLAFVQGRWEHLNRHASALTAAQALSIDCHFAIEQRARAAHGLTLNFNGTCGVWRRAAIDAVDGWHHDTLTEDMDLSYRVQLAGWRGTYASDLVVAGELPTSIEAWRAQQFRWAKGSLQTLRKHGAAVMRAPWSWSRRCAALLHLSHYLVHPLMVLLVLCAPVVALMSSQVPTWLHTVMMSGIALGIVIPLLLYSCAQILLQGWRGVSELRYLPTMSAITTGIAVSNARAAWQALRGIVSPFVRTPKIGQSKGSYRAPSSHAWPEFLLAAWMISGLLITSTGDGIWMAPLLWLYAGGFAWVGWRTIHEHGWRLGDPWLLALGAVSVLGYGVLTVVPWSWREAPVFFAVIGSVLAVLYIVSVVRIRQGGVLSVAAIIVVALAMRLVALGLAPSDDLARYAIEGTQILHGENPYAIAPIDTAVQLPATVTAPLNHGSWTAIYPPLAQYYHAVVAFFSPTPLAFKLAALVLELSALIALIPLLKRLALPSSLLVVAAWHPLGPLFITGEGHHDILMGLLLVLSLYWVGQRRIIACAAAALVKPFAVVALLPALRSMSWRWWLLPPVIALIAYAPFMAAGEGLFNSLGRFAGTMHFHAALYPLFFEVWSWLLPSPISGGVTVATLALLLMCGCWAVLRVRPPPDAGQQCARLLAVVLLCLPTLHPWYFMPLVLLLPMVRSWGLVLWTAAAPLYWLHGIAIQEAGVWTETTWVTAIAHVPALSVLGWEACGRPWWRNSQRARAVVEVRA